MLLRKYLSAFKIYIFLLVISSSTLISGLSYFSIINFIVYSFVHILLIYIIIYHFKIILYFVFFITGMIFDIFLLNEIGPHIIIFMILIPLLNQVKKAIHTLSPLRIYTFIIFTLIIVLVLEMIIALLLFNFDFQIKYLLKNIYILLIISYPTFYFFNKIDRIG